MAVRLCHAHGCLSWPAALLTCHVVGIGSCHGRAGIHLVDAVTLFYGSTSRWIYTRPYILLPGLSVCPLSPL